MGERQRISAIGFPMTSSYAAYTCLVVFRIYRWCWSVFPVEKMYLDFQTAKWFSDNTWGPLPSYTNIYRMVAWGSCWNWKGGFGLVLTQPLDRTILQWIVPTQLRMTMCDVVAECNILQGLIFGQPPRSPSVPPQLPTLFCNVPHLVHMMILCNFMLFPMPLSDLESNQPLLTQIKALPKIKPHEIVLHRDQANNNLITNRKLAD